MLAARTISAHAAGSAPCRKARSSCPSRLHREVKAGPVDSAAERAYEAWARVLCAWRSDSGLPRCSRLDGGRNRRAAADTCELRVVERHDEVEQARVSRRRMARVNSVHPLQPANPRGPLNPKRAVRRQLPIRQRTAAHSLIVRDAAPFACRERCASGLRRALVGATRGTPLGGTAGRVLLAARARPSRASLRRSYAAAIR